MQPHLLTKILLGKLIRFEPIRLDLGEISQLALKRTKVYDAINFGSYNLLCKRYKIQLRKTRKLFLNILRTFTVKLL